MLFKFSATVNGVQRSVYLPLDVLQGLTITDSTDGQEILDHVELIVDNDYGLYSAFYEDATYEDYDAELEDRVLTIEEV